MVPGAHGLMLPFSSPLSAYQQQTARHYGFLDWRALEEFTEAVADPASVVFRFEAAVEAVVDGDVDTLTRLLDEDPQLVHARSKRRTHLDPPVHRATLLHYVAANGVEGYRQRTPKNAVAIATLLLQRGAEPDSLASLYGGECTTMALLVSSCHPAAAGVQVDLIHALVDFGAAVEPRGSGSWQSPLLTALAFGYADAAEALVARGAAIEDLAAAAGLGRVDDARRLLADADALTRQRALALAAQMGHVGVVGLLLDTGVDPNRFNPPGNHAHSTPMHQAALAGRLDVVRLLVERGAHTDIQDAVYQATPLGWAEHGKQTAVVEYLRSVAAP